MVAALVCLHLHGILTRQPATIDVVSYQAVEHALPNGAPDTKAANNYYVRIKSHYILATDSDWLTPDDKGSRRVTIPARSYEAYERYEETGKASPLLDKAFLQVGRPSNPADFLSRKVRWGARDALSQVIFKGGHLVAYDRLTTVEKIETRSFGKERVTRIQRSTDWGGDVNLGRQGDVFDPSAEKVFWSDSKPEIRVDPPVYGFGKPK